MRQDTYSIVEFCQHYGLARSTFFKEVSEGRLHTFKCNHRTFITGKEGERWHKRRYRRIKNCCASHKRNRPRKTFSFGGYFKLFLRKWK